MTRAEIEAELERLHPAAFAWALACCGRDREDALDVLQTSYLKVLEGRASFAGRSSFKTFLFGVIRRTAQEARRRSLLRRLALADWSRKRPPAPAPPLPEERVALLRALEALPRRQRQVLELVFGFGMTVEEAAGTLGISPGSARVHYERGKKRLRGTLSHG
ncbi:MAG TPA: RNA polymerase sigma factor [Thermoanaerobaculia bacterium]|nr:RNA polymerase sigma factor [Thermoanaerobaculia bacterium]